jgi:hypothetical protein
MLAIRRERSMGSSEEVRDLAERNYIRPAIQGGKLRFSVAVKDVMHDLVKNGFPAGNWPQVCSALRKKTFLRQKGIEIESVDGPPSKMSTTVVYHYRIANPNAEAAASDGKAISGREATEETPEARARRLTEELRGLLKEEMAPYGGAEGFIRWVRGYDEEDAR